MKMTVFSLDFCNLWGITMKNTVKLFIFLFLILAVFNSCKDNSDSDESSVVNIENTTKKTSDDKNETDKQNDSKNDESDNKITEDSKDIENATDDSNSKDQPKSNIDDESKNNENSGELESVENDSNDKNNAEVGLDEKKESENKTDESDNKNSEDSKEVENPTDDSKPKNTSETTIDDKTKNNEKTDELESVENDSNDKNKSEVDLDEQKESENKADESDNKNNEDFKEVENPTDDSKSKETSKTDMDDENKNNESSEEINQKETDTNNIKLEANQRLIEFETAGGTEIPFQIVAVGAMAFKPLNPTKTGYTFMGWFIDKGFTTPFDFDKPVSVNMMIYAKWEINIYTVTFKYKKYFDSDSEVTITKDVEYNSTVEQPDEPEREGYTFTGWYSEGSKLFDFKTQIVNNIILTAGWKINSYTVKFDTRGGSEFEPQTVDYGSRPDYSTIPAKEFSKFIGWEDENGKRYYPISSMDSDQSKIHSDITLYAIWKPVSKNLISITVSPQSDIEVSRQDNDNKITFSVDDSYTILGWYFENQRVKTEHEYSLDISSLKKGSYILELEAQKNGKYFSYTAQITIE